MGLEAANAQLLLQALEKVQLLESKSPLKRWLLQCGAHYLGRELIDGKPRIQWRVSTWAMEPVSNA